MIRLSHHGWARTSNRKLHTQLNPSHLAEFQYSGREFEEKSALDYSKLLKTLSGLSKTSTSVAGTANAANSPTESVVEVLDNKRERQGLSSAEARLRRAQYGPNVLTETPGKTLWQRLADQFRSALIYILLIALAVDLSIWFVEGHQGLPFESIAINALTKNVIRATINGQLRIR